MGINYFFNSFRFGIGLGLLLAHSGAFAANSGISIDCVKDDGTLNHPARANQVCKSALSKCSDLANGSATSVSIKGAVLSKLSLKIWGLYNNKNIDFTQSTVADPFRGAGAFAPTICSVVGHKLKRAAGSSIDDLEINTQLIGSKKSCGTDPSMFGSNPNFKRPTVKVQFNTSNGTGRWGNWLQGAFPWVIRHQAKKILGSLKSDFSNVDTVLGDLGSMGEDLKVTINRINETYAGLTAQQKQDCSKPVNCNNVSITDPAQRICQLQQAETTLSHGALADLLIYKIMTEAQIEFDQKLGQSFILPADSNSNDFGSLYYGRCEDEGSNYHNAKKNIACAASCVFGGGEYHQSGAMAEPGCGTKRCCAVSIHSVLNNSFDFMSGPGTNQVSTQATVLSGFQGSLEKVIRLRICGQTDVTLSPPDCYDGDELPSDPKLGKFK